MFEVNLLASVTKQLTEYALERPRIFSLLNASMKLQRRLEPDAGYGALQIPKMFFGIEDTSTDKYDEQLGRLSPVEFYVFVRACYAGMMGDGDAGYVGLDNIGWEYLNYKEFSYMIDRIQETCSTFDARLALQMLLSGDTND